VIFEASRRGISVVAAHTNLDVAKGGMNDILADLLGLNRVEVLEEADQGNGVGMGRIGDLTEPTTLSGMIKHVKRILAIEKLTIVAQGNALIRRVAVVAGSGGSLLRIASEKGADLLLTGDVSHHHALEAETLRIALIDGGHFHTEKIAFRHFGDRLKEEIMARGWEVALEFDEDEFDPKREV
jgi:dinuclear metal center YbgI/SA1388 family protein